MAFHNLSPQRMFQKMAAEHLPSHAFQAGMNFSKWKKETLPLVLATLGDFPERVAPEPELIAEWNDGPLRKQRWIIDVSKHISATLLVNYPSNPTGTAAPAILCCHGHGPLGKDVMMGFGSGPEYEAQKAQYHYNYGVAMAERGYVTYAIDWIGFGDRNDNHKPNHLNNNYNRDWCNLYYLHATMFGMTSLGINITHGIAATDFVATLPGVDPKRFGVMGLSGGGTMALWMTLCDPRFLATEIICYSDLWEYFGICDLNYCGMQVAPGLYKLVDVPDLQGLIAPRPLLVDIGAYDTCFTLDSTMRCYNKVKNIYAAAEVPECLELDLFCGDHGWGDYKSESFFARWLRTEPFSGLTAG